MLHWAKANTKLLIGTATVAANKVQVTVVVAAFSSLARTGKECSNIRTLPALFFFFFRRLAPAH